MTHTCPVDGCTKMVRLDLLMCAAHWAMVRPSARRSVYRAWDRGLGRGTLAHQAACRVAIDQVNDQIKERT